MTTSIKPAATVILMREAQEGGFEIFMLREAVDLPLEVCMFFQAVN